MFRTYLLGLFKLPIRRKEDEDTSTADSETCDFSPDREDVSSIQDLLKAPGEKLDEPILKDSWEYWKPGAKDPD